MRDVASRRWAAQGWSVGLSETSQCRTSRSGGTRGPSGSGRFYLNSQIIMNLGVYILIGAYVVDYFLTESQSKHITAEEYSKLYDDWNKRIRLAGWVGLAAALLLIQCESVPERILELVVIMLASLVMAFVRIRAYRSILRVNLTGKYKEIGMIRVILSTITVLAVSISYTI